MDNRWFTDKVDVLGTTYKICEMRADEDKRLEECDGFCDWTKRTIVIRREAGDLWSLGNMREYAKKVLRHEITHAMLKESGLDASSGPTGAWAKNETMVDWIAIQGVKLYAAWKQAEAI